MIQSEKNLQNKIRKDYHRFFNFYIVDIDEVKWLKKCVECQLEGMYGKKQVANALKNDPVRKKLK